MIFSSSWLFFCIAHGSKLNNENVAFVPWNVTDKWNEKMYLTLKRPHQFSSWWASFSLWKDASFVDEVIGLKLLQHFIQGVEMSNLIIVSHVKIQWFLIMVKVHVPEIGLVDAENYLIYSSALKMIYPSYNGLLFSRTFELTYDKSPWCHSFLYLHPVLPSAAPWYLSCWSKKRKG